MQAAYLWVWPVAGEPRPSNEYHPAIVIATTEKILKLALGWFVSSEHRLHEHFDDIVMREQLLDMALELDERPRLVFVPKVTRRGSGSGKLELFLTEAVGEVMVHGKSMFRDDGGFDVHKLAHSLAEYSIDVDVQFIGRVLDSAERPALSFLEKPDRRSGKHWARKRVLILVATLYEAAHQRDMVFRDDGVLDVEALALRVNDNRVFHELGPVEPTASYILKFLRSIHAKKVARR